MKDKRKGHVTSLYEQPYIAVYPDTYKESTKIPLSTCTKCGFHRSNKHKELCK